MSDPFSGAGSAVGIISLGIQATQMLYDYYKSVKGRDSDIKHTAKKLDRLLGLLTQLASYLTNHNLTDPALIKNIESNIAQCQDSITELEEQLQKFDKTPERTFLASVKAIGRKAAYPFRKGTLTSLEENIDDIIPHVSLALQLLQQKVSDRIQLDVEDLKSVLEQLQVSQVALEIQNWLKAPDPSINFNVACKKRHSGTGMWFIQGESFNGWIQKPQSFLWLRGFAGCGKSVLCSTAIHHTILHGKSQTRTGVAFFFFTFTDKEKQTSTAMLRSLILQLANRLGESSNVLRRLHEAYRNTAPPDDVLLGCLHQLIGEYQDVYLLLDALDESPREEHRQGLLDALTEIRCWSEPGLHLLVTSRDEIDIHEELDAKDEEIIPMINDSINEDISTFVSQHLRENRQLQKWKSYHDQIEKVLAEKAKGVYVCPLDAMSEINIFFLPAKIIFRFRWVECQFIALLHCPKSPHRLEKLLNSLPKTLDETYKRMLQNIDADNKDDAVRMLTLLCCAARPLKVSEVVDALAVELVHNPGLDTARRLEDGADELQRLCPGFTEIYYEEYSKDAESDDDGDDDDYPRPFIRLAHFSVQEYLESGRIVQPEIALFAVNMQKAHALTASVCLTLLLDPRIPTWEPATRASYVFHKAYAFSPLVEYAGTYWPRHFRDSQEDQDAGRHVMQLLQNQKRALPTSILLYDQNKPQARLSLFSWEKIQCLEPTPLYFASALGLGSIVAELCEGYSSGGEFLPGTLDTGPVNEECGLGRTALWVAALNGHEEVIRILLRYGADVDKRGERVTALYRASTLGFERIAQMLLENGASPNTVSFEDNTPLQVASEWGHEALVRLLLAEGADINTCGDEGTALQLASRWGHEAIVRLLLAEGADINTCGDEGTALQLASKRGHEAIVRLLLAEGADINTCGDEGTALHYASDMGHAGVVRILLDCNADPTLLDGDGKTPLDCAEAEIGSEWLDPEERMGALEIVKLLKNHTNAASPSSASQPSPTQDGGFND